MKKPIKITIVWGEAPSSAICEGEALTKEQVHEYGGDVTTYDFETQVELNAFLNGVSEAMGWNDWAAVNMKNGKYVETD
jgi:hypothetical protein